MATRFPFCLIPLLAAACTLSFPAQSLKVETPAPMVSGVNRATLDSFVGDQFWQVWLNPGHFDVNFAPGNAQEGFDLGLRIDIAAAFKPPTPGATLNRKNNPGGAVTFSGTTPKRVLLLVGISPPNSKLVRQSIPYTLVASGSTDFSGAPAPGAAPDVTGTYNAYSHGMAKLVADGNITTTTGERGHWELFDAASRVYVVSIGRDRWSGVFQPGRGFVDQNGIPFLQPLPH